MGRRAVDLWALVPAVPPLACLAWVAWGVAGDVVSWTGLAAGAIALASVLIAAAAAIRPGSDALRGAAVAWSIVAAFLVLGLGAAMVTGG